MNEEQIDRLMSIAKEKLRKAAYYAPEIILTTSCAVTVGTIAYYRSKYTGKTLLELPPEAVSEMLVRSRGVVYNLGGHEFILTYYPSYLAALRR